MVRLGMKGAPLGPPPWAAWLCALTPVAAAVTSVGGGLRGRAGGALPGREGPRWGGRTFQDSPVVADPSGPVIPVLGDLNPSAPFDGPPRALSGTISGSAPLAPTDNGLQDHLLLMPPDLVPEYADPAAFPAEGRSAPGGTSSDEGSPSSWPITPIGEKVIIASPDKLRPSWGSRAIGPGGDYPLVAPADRISGGQFPVAAEDRVPTGVARYLDQVNGREVARQEARHLSDVFSRADRDQDASISKEEFSRELEGRQNKTAEEAGRLWSRFHTSEYGNMARAEFKELAQRGFDIGTLTRDDISSVLMPEGTTARGFWGSGATCPQGAYVVAVRLKIMPMSADPSVDNTALNAVGLKCDDGTELSSIEGPDGTWGAWVECPVGQRAYGLRMRGREQGPGRDNVGVSDLAFACRSPDFSAFSRPERWRPEFGRAAAAAGGWSPEVDCKTKEAVCGLQVSVKKDQGKGDDMGVTAMRAYCCDAQVDCSQICEAATIGVASIKCQVCREAAGLS
mmetsp:Transcript_23081/g.46948  ORF Transcript_23081/g.46948 Transcript_23081/m.46948 type:complete len:510 (-) Transcript_23081:8-1537(-)